MKVIYNNRIIEKEELRAFTFERALNYGDGLFETIIGTGSSIMHLDYHLERIKSGAAAFKIVPPPEFNPIQITEQVQELLKENDTHNDFKIKLILWRRSGGLYTPDYYDGDYFMQVQAIQKQQPFTKKAAVCKTSRVYFSPYSRFKTCNALPYVLASIEMKERGLDELIILNDKGYISECTSSNIFWQTGETYFTPSLSTGCIAGVMRRVLIEKFKAEGKAVCEVEEQPEVLNRADKIFSSNVAGIFPLTL